MSNRIKNRRDVAKRGEDFVSHSVNKALHFVIKKRERGIKFLFRCKSIISLSLSEEEEEALITKTKLKEKD